MNGDWFFLQLAAGVLLSDFIRWNARKWWTALVITWKDAGDPRKWR